MSTKWALYNNKRTCNIITISYYHQLLPVFAVQQRQ